MRRGGWRATARPKARWFGPRRRAPAAGVAVERWRNEGFAPVRAAWLRRASGIGEAIRVRLERLTIDGRFLDLDYDGALVLEGKDGPRRIAAGEVFPALG